MPQRYQGRQRTWSKASEGQEAGDESESYAEPYRLRKNLGCYSELDRNSFENFET